MAGDAPAARPPFGRARMKVMGIEVEMDATDDGDLIINDITEGMSRVASSIGWWGDVSASAEEELTQADAHYRAWRANEVKRQLAIDPKMAEWKVKAEVESHPNFLKFKHAIASAEGNLARARQMVNAFEAKSRTLQSRGAMERSALDATGMSTPTKPKPRRAPAREEATDDGADRDREPEREVSAAPVPAADPRRAKMKGMFGTPKS
jgi:hypothetical protein